MAYFLKKDLLALERKVAEIGDSLIEASLDGGDWAQQGAETWHDNFGYEEGERQKFAIGTRLGDLEALLKEAEVPQTPSGGTVQIGTLVTLTHRHHAPHAKIPHTVCISSHMVLDQRREDEISCASPLAQALIDHSIGDEIEYEAGGTKHSAVIGRIEVTPDLFA